MRCCELTPDNVNGALTRGSRLLWEMCSRCLSINLMSLPSFDLALVLRLTLRVGGGGIFIRLRRESRAGQECRGI